MKITGKVLVFGMLCILSSGVTPAGRNKSELIEKFDNSDQLQGLSSQRESITQDRPLVQQDKSKPRKRMSRIGIAALVIVLTAVVVITAFLCHVFFHLLPMAIASSVVRC